MIEYKVRVISRGYAVGEALVCTAPISFYGGVDPSTGVVVEKGHEIEGECIANKVLMFPHGKGSTVGTYVIYRLKKVGRAPVAIVNLRAEPIVALGAIISGIPMVDRIDEGAFKVVKSGSVVEVDAYNGFVRVL